MLTLGSHEPQASNPAVSSTIQELQLKGEFSVDRQSLSTAAIGRSHRYEISLEPDLTAATFAGRESIQVDVVEPVTEILLNSHELEIQKAVLRNEASSLEGSVELLEEDQRARISLDGEAAPGAWVLDLEFTGILNDQLVGFYRSTFTDVDGVEQAIATTQFEATDARRAFPSWDEPDFKAVFSITLVVPDDLFTVSNGPEDVARTGRARARSRSVSPTRW